MVIEWMLLTLLLLAGILFVMARRVPLPATAGPDSCADRFVTDFEAAESMLKDIAFNSGVATHRIGGMSLSSIPASSWTLAIELRRSGRLSASAYARFLDVRATRVELLSSGGKRVSRGDADNASRLLLLLERERHEAMKTPVMSAMVAA